MRFTPKTEKELASDGLWPAGIYDFEVISAEETTSKAGNEMVALKVKIFDNSGNSRTVFEYLVSSDAAIFKVRAFCAATGLLDQYEAGQLEALDMEGRTGKCNVVVQRGTGDYPDKNSIKSYVENKEPVKAVRRAAPARQKAHADFDDEIPF